MLNGNLWILFDTAVFQFGKLAQYTRARDVNNPLIHGKKTITNKGINLLYFFFIIGFIIVKRLISEWTKYPCILKAIDRVFNYGNAHSG